MFNLKILLRRHALRFYDPAGEQLQHSLQTTLAASISILLTLYFHWGDGAWLILCSIFLMQIKPLPTLKQKIGLPLFTGILISGVSLLTANTQHLLLLKIILIGLAGFSMIFVSPLGPQFSLAFFFITVFVIIGYGLPAKNPDLRSLLCLLGTGFAIGCSFLPFSSRHFRKKQARNNFWYLANLYWQERISHLANGISSHHYRYHLLVCFDKLKNCLTPSQAQQYAFVFELMCDILLHQEKLSLSVDPVLQRDIHHISYLTGRLLANRYLVADEHLLTQALTQTKLHAKIHLQDQPPTLFDDWLASNKALNTLIAQLRGPSK